MPKVGTYGKKYLVYVGMVMVKVKVKVKVMVMAMGMGFYCGFVDSWEPTPR